MLGLKEQTIKNYISAIVKCIGARDRVQVQVCSEKPPCTTRITIRSTGRTQSISPGLWAASHPLAGHTIRRPWRQFHPSPASPGAV